MTIDMLSYLLHFVHDFVDIDTPVVCFLLVVTIPTLKKNRANITARLDSVVRLRGPITTVQESC